MSEGAEIFARRERRWFLRWLARGGWALVLLLGALYWVQLLPFALGPDAPAAGRIHDALRDEETRAVMLLVPFVVRFTFFMLMVKWRSLSPFAPERVDALRLSLVQPRQLWPALLTAPVLFHASVAGAAAMVFAVDPFGLLANRAGRSPLAHLAHPLQWAGVLGGAVLLFWAHFWKLPRAMAARAATHGLPGGSMASAWFGAWTALQSSLYPAAVVVALGSAAHLLGGQAEVWVFSTVVVPLTALAYLWGTTRIAGFCEENLADPQWFETFDDA